jgi:hypothetical protein
MHAKLISPGTDVVTPEWHCIVGSGPKDIIVYLWVLRPPVNHS